MKRNVKSSYFILKLKQVLPYFAYCYLYVFKYFSFPFSSFCELVSETIKIFQAQSFFINSFRSSLFISHRIRVQRHDWMSFDCITRKVGFFVLTCLCLSVGHNVWIRYEKHTKYSFEVVSTIVMFKATTHQSVATF